ncbi:MAG: hypothetical protein AB1696_01685 [Planctomycetota bacterium]
MTARTRVLILGMLMGVATIMADETSIKRSDVIFMGAREKEIYEIYGATLVSWGGKPWTDNEKAIKEFQERVKVAHDLGIRYSAGAAFRTAFVGMMDFDANWRDSLCLTIEGKPITVPWLWDHKHKKTGEPAYWFCTNAPGYRKYLKWQVMLGMKASVEGLHIDDYNGTAGTEWQGCCFCKYCMTAFKEYVKTNVSADRLKACGIESPDNFDYKTFLNGKGVKTVQDFKKILGSPEHLGPDFKRFLYFSAAAFVDEARKHGEQLVGHPLMLSVNSSCSGPESLVIAPYLAYFCGEVHHGAEKPQWGPQQNWDLEPVWAFKMGDAVGRFQACTGAGWDWAYVDAHKKPGLVRMWIAQDYAFGHCLMAPHRQWAYTKEKGTHWYQSQPEDFAHVYRFVRRNAALLDGYDSVGLIVLLYSNAAARLDHQCRLAMQHACLHLAKNSVPFEIVIAGDDWLDVKLSADKLAKYKALVVCEPIPPRAGLDGEQKKAVDDFAAAGKVVKWDDKSGLDEAALRKLLPKQIAIEGAENVIAVARAIPDNPDAPAVLHLLNRNYDEPSDSMKKVTNIKVTLDKALFGGRTLSKATLYQPPAKLDKANPGASEPVSLGIRQVENGIEITVPELDLWGIVKLEK